MFGSNKQHKREEEAQIKRAIENAQNVVQVYGAELEKSADQEIKSARSLPVEENTIKTAIILLCRLADDDDYREALISGYLSLSAYQPVGNEVPNFLDSIPDYSKMSIEELRNQSQHEKEETQNSIDSYLRWSISKTKKMESLCCELCAANVIDEDRRDRFLTEADKLRSGGKGSSPL